MVLLTGPFLGVKLLKIKKVSEESDGAAKTILRRREVNQYGKLGNEI